MTSRYMRTDAQHDDEIWYTPGSEKDGDAPADPDRSAVLR